MFEHPERYYPCPTVSRERPRRTGGTQPEARRRRAGRRWCPCATGGPRGAHPAGSGGPRGPRRSSASGSAGRP
ncbi:hypothetical protein EXE58_00185 [Nocardioides seonyuensis]|uniref:Uncharacterized protein n=1 Tax=Nocardioides seonyuensis TaxID=2518371 RepID=A0A4P7IAN8_9ACTN|nr:hypothetical protein EXE58_00185 [Nocardioides seonyuensis]